MLSSQKTKKRSAEANRKTFKYLNLHISLLRPEKNEKRWKDENGRYTHCILQTPKTASSERYIIVPEIILTLLKEHKSQQEDTLKNALYDLNMVFTAQDGFYMQIGILNTHFKKFVRQLGLSKSIHLHSLRHTAASLLINAGVAPIVVAEQLGHANPGITHQIYSHVFASSRVKASQAIEMQLLTT